jgi:hypothetical protein
MKTIKVKVRDSDVLKYNLMDAEISFDDFVELINREYAKEALLECNKIASDTGLSKMELDDINAEIKAVRDAKSHS